MSQPAAAFSRFVRWFLNWETDRGYNTNLAYNAFRPTLKMTQKKLIYLSKEELCKLAGIDEEIRVTTYKAMKPYIDIVDSIKASEMTKMNLLVSGTFNK